MKNEVYEKLKSSKAIIKINTDKFACVMMNADRRPKAKVYNIVFSAKHNKPIVTEVTDEEILTQIAEDKSE